MCPAAQEVLSYSLQWCVVLCHDNQALAAVKPCMDLIQNARGHPLRLCLVWPVVQPLACWVIAIAVVSLFTAV